MKDEEEGMGQEKVILLQEIISARGRRLRLRIRGASMSPTLRDGDLVEVRPVEPAQLRVGDLVLFKTQQGDLLVHRCVTKSDENGQVWFTTKGDASPSFDSPIGPEQVLGRVNLILRKRRPIYRENSQARLINYILARLSPYSSSIGRLAKGLGLQKLGCWR
jgi:signal peptidase